MDEKIIEILIKRQNDLYEQTYDLTEFRTKLEL